MTVVKKKGVIETEAISRLIKHADRKDAAAQFPQMEDGMRRDVFETSPLKRSPIRNQPRSYADWR
ncbi:hypothetical protein [Candidatus Nitrospira nitrificans]|uniref:hypothetical protein n=1 Tax=Candidatus Nitrospira nitrificans TaxID=1742973 RepID=UPI001111B3CF|nr:hypothetical protein [Candidatus Nitrospira nitrificans]